QLFGSKQPTTSLPALAENLYVPAVACTTCRHSAPHVSPTHSAGAVVGTCTAPDHTTSRVPPGASINTESCAQNPGHAHCPSATSLHVKLQAPCCHWIGVSPSGPAIEISGRKSQNIALIKNTGVSPPLRSVTVTAGPGSTSSRSSQTS